LHARDIELLFDYSYAATRIILERSERLTEEQWVAEPPLGGAWSLQRTLVHMLDVERAWREELRTDRDGDVPTFDPADFPDARTLAAAWREDERVMREWLASLDDAAVKAPTHEPWPLLWQCLVHIVNHSMQHRSEAAMILTHFGQSPGDLDFTFYFKGFSDD